MEETERRTTLINGDCRGLIRFTVMVWWNIMGSWTGMLNCPRDSVTTVSWLTIWHILLEHVTPPVALLMRLNQPPHWQKWHIKATEVELKSFMKCDEVKSHPTLFHIKTATDNSCKHCGRGCCQMDLRHFVHFHDWVPKSIYTLDDSFGKKQVCLNAEPLSYWKIQTLMPVSLIYTTSSPPNVENHSKAQSNILEKQHKTIPERTDCIGCSCQRTCERYWSGKASLHIRHQLPVAQRII